MASLVCPACHAAVQWTDPGCAGCGAGFRQVRCEGCRFVAPRERFANHACPRCAGSRLVIVPSDDTAIDEVGLEAFADPAGQDPPPRGDRTSEQPGPPVLLGALGQKALERVARTYDGWYPFVQSLAGFQQDMGTLRKLAAEAGRNPDTLAVTAIVDPRNDGPSVDDLKRYRDAGASRIVVYSQQTRQDDADGKALEVVKRLAAVVERAQKVPS